MVYDMSEGFWSRWIMFNFPYTFKDKEEYLKMDDKTNIKLKDSNIIEKISTPSELSGLLNRFLQGYERLKNKGEFSNSIGTQAIKTFWIRKSNSFMAFAMDNLIEDYEGVITKKEMRRRYSIYCKEHKIVGKSDMIIKRVIQELYGAIEDRKIIGEYPNSEQTSVWSGLKWK
jgi:phage/plasmid-associated DNA primase